VCVTVPNVSGTHTGYTPLQERCVCISRLAPAAGADGPADLSPRYPHQPRGVHTLCSPTVSPSSQSCKLAIYFIVRSLQPLQWLLFTTYRAIQACWLTIGCFSEPIVLLLTEGATSEARMCSHTSCRPTTKRTPGAASRNLQTHCRG
jgi:hypothetical protein